MRTWTALLPLPLLATLLPALASAADGVVLGELSERVKGFGDFLNILIGFFVALAIVIFFWGLVKYLWGATSENAQEGLKLMFWGLIGILVMVSIWGIIGLLRESFDVGGEENDAPIHVDTIDVTRD